MRTVIDSTVTDRPVFVAFFAAALAALLAAAPGRASAPSAFRASYDLRVSALGGRSEVVLAPSAEPNEQLYRSVTRAKGIARLLRSKPIVECSRFRYVEPAAAAGGDENGARERDPGILLRPLEYAFIDGAPGEGRSSTVVFDWEAGVAAGSYKEREERIALDGGARIGSGETGDEVEGDTDRESDTDRVNYTDGGDDTNGEDGADGGNDGHGQRETAAAEAAGDVSPAGAGEESDEGEETDESVTGPGAGGEILDRMTEQLAVMRDLADGGIDEPYRIVERNELRTIRYEKLGEERVETGAGVFDTVKYRRRREGSRRSSVIWFAPELQYFPVQIEQYKEDDRQATARLDEYERLAPAEAQALGSVTPRCP